MAIQKKSLIGNLSATKKAIVATNAVSTTPVATMSSIQTAKRKDAFKASVRHEALKGGGRHEALKAGGRHEAFKAGGRHEAFKASFDRATAKIAAKK